MGSEQTSESITSLPKGGGALQGIGEKFSPDLFTGTGNFTIPIALPPGRNGFQPQLSLSYSTGNGGGVFGLGWALSIPCVSRKTSKEVPRYQDDRDVFVLSGSEIWCRSAPRTVASCTTPERKGCSPRLSTFDQTPLTTGRSAARTGSRATDCLAIFPCDAPSELFLERIAQFRVTAPCAEWNGVWSLVEK
jgi:hypothetical protein